MSLRTCMPLCSLFFALTMSLRFKNAAPKIISTAIRVREVARAFNAPALLRLCFVFGGDYTAYLVGAGSDLLGGPTVLLISNLWWNLPMHHPHDLQCGSWHCRLGSKRRISIYTPSIIHKIVKNQDGVPVILIFSSMKLVSILALLLCRPAASLGLWPSSVGIGWSTRGP